MKKIAFLSILALSACSSTMNWKTDASGKKIYTLDCNPMQERSCNLKAKNTCPNGLEVLSQGTRTVGHMNNGWATPINRYIIEFSCKQEAVSAN